MQRSVVLALTSLLTVVGCSMPSSVGSDSESLIGTTKFGGRSIYR